MQLAATRGSFTASNLEAVHQYGVAMELQSAGKMQDALQSFSKAAELDPNFARAYAGMAATSRSLGNAQNAEKYIKLAMAHVDRMTERERYRVRGLVLRHDRELAEMRRGIQRADEAVSSRRYRTKQSRELLRQLANTPRAMEVATASAADCT